MERDLDKYKLFVIDIFDKVH